MHDNFVLTAIVSLALVGCSEPPQLNEEDSRVAFMVLSETLAAGAEAALGGSGTAASSGDSPVFRDEASATVDYDFACPGGGKAHFSGTAKVSDDLDDSQSAIELSTEFFGCKAKFEDITIDGSMDYAASVSDSIESSSATLSMNGSLSFSGDINGACDLDLKLSTKVTNQSSSAEYVGSLCGHDAALTISVQD